MTVTPSRPAIDWAAARLADRGWTVTGEPEVAKDRPWSLVVRLPTDHGLAWLKVNRGGTTYEPAVLALLARVAPDQVLHPLALDLDRGWSVNPDGGATLRSTWGGGTPDGKHLGRVLRAYVGLQRATAPHAGALLAAGVPDLRPEVLPARLDDLLEGSDWSLLAQGQDPDPAAYDRVMAHRARFGAQCAELVDRSAALGIPMTLQHDDLHDNNVFVSADACSGASTSRIFDWGDSCVSHPFCTLLVALRSYAAASGQSLDAPAVRELRWAYLDGWGDLAPRAELDRLADLAVSVGPVGRAHSWRNALVEAGPEEVEQFADAVPGWLSELAPLPTLPSS